jgi:D-3-phosphoglycerate dehydrogenase / 2-oxoglutarate reductase
MKNILCLNNISPVGLNVLPKEYQITKDVSVADAILVRSANMLEMPLPANVLAVARAGAGVNNIPLETYAKQGIVVFNTPGANANAVKELTIAGMLFAARDIYGGMKWIKENKTDVEINKNMEKAKAAFAGTEIMGKTIGVIGLGAVGALVAQGAGALGMKVIGIDASPEVIEKNRHLLPSDITLVTSYDDLYAHADYISLNVPLIPPTKGMINKNSIAKMKDGVVILNIARDAIVNDADIKEALLAKKVRKYVTDFPNYETANMEGVIAMPHLGASTEEAEDNCAFMASQQIVNFIENGNIVNSVNYPNIDGGVKTAPRRMICLHENTDKLAISIIQAVEARADILQMITKAKGSYAVTMVDFAKPNKDCTNSLCLADEVDAMQGVIKVRVIH